MPDLSYVWSELGHPILMTFVLSMIIGCGFRIGWLFADLVRRRKP